MKIVAFLQNPWFPEGTDERHIIVYRDNQEFHRRLLSGTMSGGRLKQAFGDLYDQIHWDNSNWRPAWHASGKVDADLNHMRDVLFRERPFFVLTFGNQAKDAFADLLLSMAVPMDRCPELLQCHHPNARGKTQQDLDDFATLVRRKMLEHDLLGKKLKTSEEAP